MAPFSWEKEPPQNPGRFSKVPKWADKLVRLLYEAHADGREAIRNVVARINAIDRLTNQRITLESSSQGWAMEPQEALAA